MHRLILMIHNVDAKISYAIMQYISGISVRRIWPTRLQGVFVVKIALSSCSSRISAGFAEKNRWPKIRRKKCG